MAGSTEELFHLVTISENPCSVSPMISLMDLPMSVASVILSANKVEFGDEQRKMTKTMHFDDKDSNRCMFLGRVYSKAPEGASPNESGSPLLPLCDIPLDKTVLEVCKENNFDSVWTFEFRVNVLRSARFCRDFVDGSESHRYCTATAVGDTKKYRYPLPDPPKQDYFDYLLAKVRDLQESFLKRKKTKEEELSELLGEEFAKEFLANQFDPKDNPPPLDALNDNQKVEIIGASKINGVGFYIARPVKKEKEEEEVPVNPGPFVDVDHQPPPLEEQDPDQTKPISVNNFHCL